MRDTSTQSVTGCKEALASITRALKCIILVLEFSEELVEFLVVGSMHVVCELARKGYRSMEYLLYCGRKFTSCNIVCTTASSSRKVSGAQAGRNLKRIFSPPFMSKMRPVQYDGSVLSTCFSLNPTILALEHDL